MYHMWGKTVREPSLLVIKKKFTHSPANIQKLNFIVLALHNAKRRAIIIPWVLDLVAD